jgi:hypothetical protein
MKFMLKLNTLENTVNPAVFKYFSIVYIQGERIEEMK